MKIYVNHTRQGRPGETNVLVEESFWMDNELVKLGLSYEEAENAEITFWDDATYNDMFNETTGIAKAEDFKEEERVSQSDDPEDDYGISRRFNQGFTAGGKDFVIFKEDVLEIDGPTDDELDYSVSDA